MDRFGHRQQRRHVEEAQVRLGCCMRVLLWEALAL